jgi:predicted nucleic acid-binding Zn ribbon protein
MRMPLADYEDNITKEVFEVFFKNSQIPDSIINEKTGNESTRLTSKPIGFKLIGAGFYVNEYPKST